MSKFVFVVGGVMSGVGKGVSTASMATLLQSCGYKVTAMKIDPYINVDAGTMNPVEHGEVFVTRDGDETDQDIGHYERFLHQDIPTDNYMTTGRVYQSVIERERKLEYGGKCVEVVPHVPQEVIDRIQTVAKRSGADVVFIEIGGTVGEYQNILFLEAARMMKSSHPKDVAFVLVSYLPIPSKIGEMKTKPTQYAARTLNASGINADFILCRASQVLDEPRREKLALFCNIPKDHVISAPDVDSIYQVPFHFVSEQLDRKLMETLGLPVKSADLSVWESFVKQSMPAKTVKVGMVGKYFMTGDFILKDAYISVIEALKHACAFLKVGLDLQWISSEEFEQHPEKLTQLSSYDGIVIPGGFGKRGIEGKIAAIEYIRTHNIPFLGLCYGMQLACIEFARHVAGLSEATSEELDEKTPHPVIHIMPEQKEVMIRGRFGGTMRLGAYPCVLKPGSKASEIYKGGDVWERHRHRYEFNNTYRERLAYLGLSFSGLSPDGRFVEIIELPQHPFFVGVQFHPEFQSRPLQPHPLFVSFIQTSEHNKKISS